MATNFSHLRPYDEQLFRLGVLAERYFPEDPNTALLKLRQLGGFTLRCGAQTRGNAAALFFKREGGGWPRLNRLFGGELEVVLGKFQREVWAA